MKTIVSALSIFMLSVVLPVFPAQAQQDDSVVVRLSDPVVQSATTETFGERIDWTLPRRSLAQLLSEPQTQLGKPFLLETEIVQVCQKKGCFFIARDGASSVRVAFRDYGFFVPTDSGGKTVTLAGELVARQMSEEEAGHYRADLGGEGEIASGRVFEIVANSVQIPRTP